MDESGRIVTFDNGFVVRFLDKVVVEEEGYSVQFKAGVKIKIETAVAAVAG